MADLDITEVVGNGIRWVMVEVRLGIEVSVHLSALSSPGYYLDLTIFVNGSEFHSKRITDFYNGRIEIQAILDAGQNIVFSIVD